MTTKTTSKKAIDRRVSKAFNETCSGITIDIMDTVKVMDVGRGAIADGADDETLRRTVRAFVETIRCS